MKIEQSIIIDSPKHHVVDFFNQLVENPGKYKFDTHGGIFPIEGSLNEVGSIFETVETFGFITIKLRFETIEVNDAGSFKFRLIGPISFINIFGEFSVMDFNERSSKLSLIVYGNNTGCLTLIFQLLIFYTPIRFLIKQQTYSELEFIRDIIQK